MIKRKIAGFTLVEMAVVLVIIGLTLGAVLGVSATQLQSSRIAATKQKQEVIRLALVNFIARNNRLPCPAIATREPGEVGYGIEALNPGTCTDTVTSGTVVTGVVPWISLGISDENAIDGYYSRFTYQVTLEATNRTAATISGLRGAIATHSGTPVSAATQGNNCTPAGHTYNPCNIVVMVVSHGSNKFGAYSEDGIQSAMPTGADELENVNADNNFVIKDFSENNANPFDDLLLPLSTVDLLTPLWSRGVIKDYQTKFNDDKRDISAAVTAVAHSDRDLITPLLLPPYYSYKIPASLPSLPIHLRVDPWGMNYTYIRSIAAVNSSTPQDTLVFTLISSGPDPDPAATTDDISIPVYMSDIALILGASGW